MVSALCATGTEVAIPPGSLIHAPYYLADAEWQPKSIQNTFADKIPPHKLAGTPLVECLSTAL